MSRALLVAVLLVALAACNRREPPPRAAPTTPAPAHEAAARGAPAPLPEPVERVFRMSDGVSLHGTLYRARETDAPGVILVHQLGSTRAEWGPVVAALREEPALTVLTFDLRGHGESTEGPDGPLSYGSFDTAAWAALENDVVAAVLELRGDEALVHPSRIAVVGSSIGATAVVRAAARDPELDVIALLSPGRAYHGVDGILPAVAMGRRALLALASSQELDSVETSQTLARITGGRVETYDGQAHGVALFADHEERLDLLVTFLRESLAAPRPSTEAAPVPAEEAPVGEAAPSPRGATH